MGNERPTDEPDTHSFNDMFGSANDFMAWVNKSPIEEFVKTVEIELTPEEETLKIHYAKQFFTSVYDATTLRKDIRKLVEEAPQSLQNWKLAVKTLNQRGAVPINVVTIIENTSLQYLAKIAKEEFSQVQKKMGSSILNSQEYKNQSSWAEYWSRIDQVMSSAAQDEEKNS